MLFESLKLRLSEKFYGDTMRNKFNLFKVPQKKISLKKISSKIDTCLLSVNG